MTVNGGVVTAGAAVAVPAVTIRSGIVMAQGDIKAENGPVTISGGSVKGGVTPRPVNAGGQPVYLLQVANPNGETVTINGAAWNINNHAASGEGDTDLYMYRSESAVRVAVGSETPVWYVLNADKGLYEAVTTVNYYDPVAGQVQTRDSAEPLVNGTTSWSPDNGTGGWYIALGTVTTRQVTVSGDVNLILANGASLTCKRGINVQEGSHLTIWGQNADYTKDGVLTSSGTYGAVGIGTHGDWHDHSRVVINGGVITAVGGAGGAGIGGGSGTTNFTMDINGGVVTARGGYHAAGIGAGTSGSWGTSGYIAIYGGTVTATGGESCADIGNGYGSGTNIYVTITGGSVKGSVGVQPGDGNGNPAYLLTVSNPNGMAVTIGDKQWQPRNHAALDNDTNLCTPTCPRPWPMKAARSGSKWTG